MKIFFLLLCLASCLVCSLCLINDSKFTELYVTKCFPLQRDNKNLRFGQVIPEGFTLSTFLNKVEVLEDRLPGKTAREMATILLRGFSLDDYVFGVGRTSVSVKGDVIKRRSLLTHLLADAYSNVFDALDNIKLPDDFQCNLVFTLSHNNNYTVNSTTDSVYSTERASQNREEGVLTILGDTETTLSIGKVLYGIAATSPDVKNMSIVDAARKLDTTVKEDEFPQRDFDTLPAVTVSDVIGNPAKIITAADFAKFEGNQGSWLNTSCPLEYRLSKSSQTSSTDAQITGAIDGYILGSVLRNNNNLAGLKLSQLLRAYYSKTGIPQSQGQASFCDRRELYNHFNQGDHVKNQAKAVSLLLLHADGTVAKKDKLDGNLNIVYERFENVLKTSENGERMREICQPPHDNPTCETPIHLFVVLDTKSETLNDNEKRNNQIKILGAIVNQLNPIANNSFTVLAPKKSTRNEGGLREIIQQSGSSGCVSCVVDSLKELEDDIIGNDDGKTVFESLNRTLLNYEKKPHVLGRNGISNKVVIYLNLQDEKHKDAETVRALNLLKNSHRDTKVFAIGNKDVLNDLNEDSNALIVYDAQNVLNDLNQVKEIVNRLCKQPALLRYRECGRSSARQELGSIFEGHVTKDSVQYWAYYPEYFHGSKSLTITFQPADQNARIKVCEVPSNTGNKLDVCKGENENKVVFKYTSPCKYGPAKCEPKIFSVMGIKSSGNNTDSNSNDLGHCTSETFCQDPFQIKFRVTHTGMYCAGVFSALFHPLTLLVTLLAILKNYVQL